MAFGELYPRVGFIVTKHPDGLANGSGQVGRNYMRHNQSVLMALMHEPNETMFQKTLAVSDYYFGSDDWDYPLGLIQMCGKSHGAQIRGEALPSWLEWMPKIPFDEMARHSMDFWLSSEDLPRPENRIHYDGERVVLEITEGNMEAHRRLVKGIWSRRLSVVSESTAATQSSSILILWFVAVCAGYGAKFARLRE